MAEITNVINVALLPEGKAAAATNMNVVAIITKEQGVLSTAERYRTYKSAAAVAGDFGTSSEVTARNIVLQPSPALLILVDSGWLWRGQRNSPATPVSYRGQMTDAAALRQLTRIDGHHDS